MKSNKSVNKITILNILSTLILQGLTFFASPIISRMLGPSNYGMTSVYATWVALFSTIFGLQTQSTIAVARKEYPEEEQKAYQSSILTLSMLAYLLFSAVVLCFSIQLTDFMGFEHTAVFLILFQALGQFVVTFVNTKFTYEFKAIQNFILTVLVSVSTLGLSLVLIGLLPKEGNYWGRLLGQMIPYTIIGIGLCIYILFIGKSFVNKGYWKFCIPLCVPIIFHSVSNLVLNQSDRVMLQSLIGNSEAGIYSLAYSFGSVLSTVWTALNNSWVPFYYEHSRKGEMIILKQRARNYIELFTVIAIGFNLVYPEVYHIFAGREYWSGTQLIKVFTLGFYCMFLYSFPVNYEFYNKKTKLIAVGTVMSAICNIILNYYLILSLEMYGAAIATAISYLLQFVFHYTCVKRIAKDKSDYPFSFGVFLPYISLFCVSLVLCSLSSEFQLIRWIIGVSIGLFELFRIFRRKTIF